MHVREMLHILSLEILSWLYSAQGYKKLKTMIRDKVQG